MRGHVSTALFLIATLGTTADADLIMLSGFLGFLVWGVWILEVSVP